MGGRQPRWTGRGWGLGATALAGLLWLAASGTANAQAAEGDRWADPDAAEAAIAAQRRLARGRLARSQIKSAPLRRLWSDAWRARAAMPRAKPETRREVAAYRYRAAATSMDDAIVAMFMRESGMNPPDIMMLLVTHVEPRVAPDLEVAASALGPKRDAAGSPASAALRDAIARALAADPHMRLYSGHWVIGDAVGAQAQGFVVVDSRTREMLWVSFLEWWSV